LGSIDNSLSLTIDPKPLNIHRGICNAVCTTAPFGDAHGARIGAGKRKYNGERQRGDQEQEYSYSGASKERTLIVPFHCVR
jgi:hypothetical protein